MMWFSSFFSVFHAYVLLLPDGKATARVNLGVPLALFLPCLLYTVSHGPQ